MNLVPFVQILIAAAALMTALCIYLFGPSGTRGYVLIAMMLMAAIWCVVSVWRQHPPFRKPMLLLFGILGLYLYALGEAAFGHSLIKF